jgi:hypothetical protein
MKIARWMSLFFAVLFALAAWAPVWAADGITDQLEVIADDAITIRFPEGLPTLSSPLPIKLFLTEKNDTGCYFGEELKYNLEAFRAKLSLLSQDSKISLSFDGVDILEFTAIVYQKGPLTNCGKRFDNVDLSVNTVASSASGGVKFLDYRRGAPSSNSHKVFWVKDKVTHSLALVIVQVDRPDAAPQIALSLVLRFLREGQKSCDIPRQLIEIKQLGTSCPPGSLQYAAMAQPTASRSFDLYTAPSQVEAKPAVPASADVGPTLELHFVDNLETPKGRKEVLANVAAFASVQKLELADPRSPEFAARKTGPDGVLELPDPAPKGQRYVYFKVDRAPDTVYRQEFGPQSPPVTFLSPRSAAQLKPFIVEYQFTFDKGGYTLSLPDSHFYLGPTELKFRSTGPTSGKFQGPSANPSQIFSDLLLLTEKSYLYRVDVTPQGQGQDLQLHTGSLVDLPVSALRFYPFKYAASEKPKLEPASSQDCKMVMMIGASAFEMQRSAVGKITYFTPPESANTRIKPGDGFWLAPRDALDRKPGCLSKPLLYNYSNNPNTINYIYNYFDEDLKGLDTPRTPQGEVTEDNLKKQMGAFAFIAQRPKPEVTMVAGLGQDWSGIGNEKVNQFLESLERTFGSLDLIFDKDERNHFEVSRLLIAKKSDTEAGEYEPVREKTTADGRTLFARLGSVHSDLNLKLAGTQFSIPGERHIKTILSFMRPKPISPSVIVFLGGTLKDFGKDCPAALSKIRPVQSRSAKVAFVSAIEGSDSPGQPWNETNKSGTPIYRCADSRNAGVRLYFFSVRDAINADQGEDAQRAIFEDIAKWSTE